MSNLFDRIHHNFSESIQSKINTADTILPSIEAACNKVVQCLLDGHKIMSAGSGSSACNALHFASQMLNRFKHERPGLPAIALSSDILTLTAIANDSNYNDIFAKQLRALGQPGDLLLAMCASENTETLLHTIKAAHDRNINVIALTGHDGGKIAETLKESDIEVRVPTTDSTRIQETHLLIIHCICDSVDYQLFGHGELVT